MVMRRLVYDSLHPLYVRGKRDKARRYVNPSTGEIISRRQYINLTEGVSPESKAYARYLVKPSGSSHLDGRIRFRIRDEPLSSGLGEL